MICCGHGDPFQCAWRIPSPIPPRLDPEVPQAHPQGGTESVSGGATGRDPRIPSRGRSRAVQHPSDHVHLVAVIPPKYRRVRHRREDQSQHEPGDPPAVPLGEETLLAERVLVGRLLLVHRRHRRSGHQAVRRVSGEGGQGATEAPIGFRVLTQSATGVSPWVSTSVFCSDYRAKSRRNILVSICLPLVVLVVL